MKTKFLLFVAVAFSTVFAGCKKDASSGAPIGTTDKTTKYAPDGFAFNTTKSVTVNVTLLSNNNTPIANAIIAFYATDADQTNTTNAIYKGVTDKSGILKATFVVPTTYKQVSVSPVYVGVPTNITVSLANTTANVTIGGKTGYSGDVVINAIPERTTINTAGTKTFGLTSLTYGYPSPYNTDQDAVLNTVIFPFALGVPKYLETVPDVIDTYTLGAVNASLPEGNGFQGRTVADLHPQYLASSAASNIVVTTTSDIYVTFVSEGAGYLNSLGYYTYQTNNPPTSKSGGTANNGIDKITMVFPNASGLGSGGGLHSGDKVKLGNFPAGTTIGFVLLSNAWSSSGLITAGPQYFTDAQFNPETQAGNKKHSVELYDSNHKQFIIGFEDKNRETDNGNGTYTDNDFNDLVIYASSAVTNAISTTNVQSIDTSVDTDGDGVLDVYDAFPNDATKAYITYFPSATGYTTLAYEDNFPNKGDYDMNDLVVNVQYIFVQNAQNASVSAEMKVKVAAVGASFKNGFGIELPGASPSNVKSVTGQIIKGSLITFASNGVEAGQTNAVVIPFDNTDAVINNPDGAFFINTLAGKPAVTGTPIDVLVTFNNPQNFTGNFNPFLISNQRRGYEVHLAGYAMTSKGNSALFGTGDDISNQAGKASFTSSQNLPWAILFKYDSFAWPYETQSIMQAYPHFVDWAAAGGNSFQDWYSNLTGSGYRDASKIYH